MKISRLALAKTFDSRGEPTLTMTLWDADSREFHADVPAGKSTGSREAKVHKYEDAFRSLKKIEPRLRGPQFRSSGEFDRLLRELDGTVDKSNLGGNLTLALSIAALRAIAGERDMEPWQVLREEYFEEEKKSASPLIFSNLVNGGAHARNDLDIQEYMVVARSAGNMAETVSALIGIYRELGAILAKRTKGPLLLGDEGGYDVEFKNNLEPLAMLQKILTTRGHKTFGLALDVAASNFFGKTGYRFDGKTVSRAQLAKTYESYFRKADRLMSIEDPFAENDTEGWKNFRASGWVVGDDLTTTNAGEIRLYAPYISGVIIKPNQIGTVQEACEAILTAKKDKLKTIVSHRSGETGDTFIIHLAKAAGADAVKIGAPARERIIKFNELIRLYD